MKNKKGFTLIELLAVIVILAVIALIVTPLITGIIEDARMNSSVRSVEGYLNSVTNATLKSILDPNKGINSNGVYTVSELLGKVEYKGNGPTEGWVKVEKNQVTACSLKQDEYIINCTGDNNMPSITTDISISQKPSGESVAGKLPTGLTKGAAVYINPETASVCSDYVETNSATGTKTGCMKWYVYKNNNDKTYQLILDHNTTALVAWNSSGDNTEGMNEVATALTNDVTGWSSSLNARLITADEIAEITGNNAFSGTSSTSDEWFYFDSNNQTQVAYSATKSNYAWLYDYTNDCELSGCNIKDASTYGYWTSTPVFDSNFAWRVYSDGGMYSGNVFYDYLYGLRPVISF